MALIDPGIPEHGFEPLVARPLDKLFFQVLATSHISTDSLSYFAADGRSIWSSWAVGLNRSPEWVLTNVERSLLWYNMQPPPAQTINQEASFKECRIPYD